MRNKDKQINIRISNEERKLLERRMQEMGVKNMSAFMIKMALDGYCVKLDLTDVKEPSCRLHDGPEVSRVRSH